MDKPVFGNVRSIQMILFRWIKLQKKKKKARKSSDSDEDDIDVTKSLERSEAEISAALSKISMDEQEENVDKELNKFFYKRVAKHYLADEARKENKAAMLTSAAYHKKSKILVTGFSNGCFFIYEMPEVNIIHSLNISEQKISAIAMNNTGDWIALGCSGLGQLLVWEWQSETYVMKQQGHANNMNCVAYSNDGQIVATGGEDGKVKLWNTTSGFCFVTFSEHSGAVTGLAFCAQKNFLVSTSLDGTARAYDIIRYRNFRTFTSPRPVQFSCVAVDSSGEFVVAGGQDVFDIYLWAVKTGRLLEILSGHEGPVGGLSFTTNPTSTVLASASWDGTLRIWDALEKGSAHETIQIGSDGLCVAFRPDSAEEVAVATLDGQVTVFNAKTANQVASINGKNDLQSGRSETDLITAKKSQEAKAFTSICYSADGQYLLAGGQSKNVCIYNVKEGLLVKKFEITQNRSFDAVDDFINRRKMTQFGNVALVEEREAREGGNVAIKLPGVRKGDMASRVHKPEVRVFSLIFSPTGQQWAAATTEGLLIYGLNSGLVFDPFDLELDVTPAALRNALQKKDHVNGLIMALKLNEANLIQEAIESIPVKDIELTVLNLAPRFVEKTLVVVATALESSHHLEFYLTWAQQILSTHGPRLRIAHITPTLLSLHKSLLKNYQQLSHICDFNKYTMKYVANLGEVAEKKLTQKMEASDAEDDGALTDEYMVEEVDV